MTSLYQKLQSLDRRIRKKYRLPRPVLSVGNLAMGGRGKTPFVQYLVKKLQEEDFEPVVLTRGYGRRVKKNFFLTPEAGRAENIVDSSGDEALEIFLQSAATVLVGKDRYKNALSYFRNAQHKEKMVFVLDDGFQHWSLERDLDIVLVEKKDLNESLSLFPFGELREPASSLGRADFVFEWGVDLEKESHFNEKLTDLAVLTTRANTGSYIERLKTKLGDFEHLKLRDHASSEKIFSALKASTCKNIIVSPKEAVKLMKTVECREFFKNKEISLGAKNYYLAELKIKVLNLAKEEELWKKVKSLL